MAPRFKLKLTSLKFISAVDAGAQGEISNVALLKRHDANGIEATCQVVKVDSSLGLVFGWALASSLDGGKTQHVDLQGDAIQNDDLIKVAAEFMESAAASDVMHDDAPDGRIVFAMPLVPEINAALGIQSDVHGLAIAMKPSPETFKRFQSGELKAFSIAGQGERTPLVEKVAPGKIATADIARSLARVSPRKTTANKMAPQPENKMTLEEALAKIAELEAKLAELDKAKDGTEEVKPEAEIAALKAQIAELTKSVVSIDKSDPIAHTCADGTVIRKSDGALALKFAKQADEAILLATVEKAARERTELVKRATDMMGTLAGTHDEHADILKGVESTGNAKAVQSFTAIVNAATSAMKAASVAKGAGGEAIVNTGPQAEFDALVTKHTTDHKVEPGAARLAVVKTEVGRALYGAIEQLKKSRAHG